MKHPVIAALVTLWSFAAVAQTAPVGEPKALSSRDQIKANRAKENADEAKRQERAATLGPGCER